MSPKKVCCPAPALLDPVGLGSISETDFILCIQRGVCKTDNFFAFLICNQKTDKHWWNQMHLIWLFPVLWCIVFLYYWIHLNTSLIHTLMHFNASLDKYARLDVVIIMRSAFPSVWREYQHIFQQSFTKKTFHIIQNTLSAVMSNEFRGRPSNPNYCENRILGWLKVGKHWGGPLWLTQHPH